MAKPDGIVNWQKTLNISPELIASLSISGGCVLVMLLLLMWRGRRS
jgi:hypothetical protein